MLMLRKNENFSAPVTTTLSITMAGLENETERATILDVINALQTYLNTLPFDVPSWVKEIRIDHDNAF